MARWRWATSLVWVAIIGLPIFAVIRELIIHPSGWLAWTEWDRLLDLAKNSIALTLGTVVVAVPLGSAAGLLLHRSDLPGKSLFRNLMILALFVPLPLLASAWQSALGSSGWMPLPVWRTIAPSDPDYSPTGISWKPWAHGLTPAIWIHAVAGLPWVIWLSGIGFSRVERNLEEDALTNGGARSALWHVTLPRAAPALGLATIWVAVQTSTEISITDMMQVRTFAEEVYTQFARPDPVIGGAGAHDAAARALAVAVPPSLLGMLIVLALFWRWEKRMPPLTAHAESWELVRLGRWQWVTLIGMLMLVLALVGVPVASLFWKTGQVLPGSHWSAKICWQNLVRAYHAQHGLVASSLFASLITAIIVSVIAVISCWLIRDRRWLGIGALAVLIFAWMIPGPVLGIGLKESISMLMTLEDTVSGHRLDVFRQLLYDGVSLQLSLRGVTELRINVGTLPVMWATSIRFLPCAVALLWPVTRMISTSLFDVARSDGVKPSGELRHVVTPAVSSALAKAVVAVTALSLGELSAGKLVETPDGQTFSHEVFMQMHYGTSNHLAALCLLLLGTIALLLLLFALAQWAHRNWRLVHQALRFYIRQR
jgi:iron(III) transport system permease protein